MLLPTVLHHLPPDAVPAALAEAWRCCRGLLIVADVCRCPVAAWAFPLLGCLVGFGAVTRHDGRASLRRALTPAALARAAAQAGLPAPQVVRHAGCRMTLLARVGP